LSGIFEAVPRQNILRMKTRNCRLIIETENPPIVGGGGAHAKAQVWHVPAVAPVNFQGLKSKDTRHDLVNILRCFDVEASPHCLTREAINT